MPRSRPYAIALTHRERSVLETRTRRYTLPYRDVMRARIVLLAAEGPENKEIGERLDMPRPVVSKWRKRFFLERLAGLEDRSRGGRPPTFPPRVVAEVKAPACELPAGLRLPLSRFSRSELRRPQRHDPSRPACRQPVPGTVRQSHPGAPAHARELDQPDRDLLLDPAAQSPHARSLHFPGPSRRPYPRLPAALPADRLALPMEVHPTRPHPSHGPHARIRDALT